MNGGDVILLRHRAFHHNAKRHLPTIFRKCGHTQHNAAIGHRLVAQGFTHGGGERIIRPRRSGEGQRQKREAGSASDHQHLHAALWTEGSAARISLIQGGYDPVEA